MVSIIFITDFSAFLISIIGLATSFSLIVSKASRSSCSNNPEPEIQDETARIVNWLKPSQFTDTLKIKLLLADYEAGNRVVDRGQNVTYVSGTILIVASFTLLASAATSPCRSNGAFSLASIGLLIIWLLAIQ